MATKIRKEQLFTGFSDGWMPVTGTWAYASATTITVPSGATSLYQKGDKIKLTSNSVVLYAYIISVADTTLTVLGNAITNYTFSNVFFSRANNPFGFPARFTTANTQYFYMNGGMAVLTGQYAATLTSGQFEVTPTVTFDITFASAPQCSVNLANGSAIFGAAAEWSIVNGASVPTTTTLPFHVITRSGTWGGNRAGLFDWIAIGPM